MDDFKNDPIYKEELIRERARLDEKARRDKEAAARKKQKEAKESGRRWIINIVLYSAVFYILIKIIWMIGPFHLQKHMW